MKWLIRPVARFYPRSWRERYGVEFGALLEDLRPDWRTPLDILRGAFQMQMMSWGLGTILALSGTVGALVAFGASFAIPKRYLSTAVLMITPKPPRPMPTSAIDREMGNRINSLSQIALSREALVASVVSFGLYKTELSRLPIEDVLEIMRRDIQIQPAANMVEDIGRIPGVEVRFSYQDGLGAQQVVKYLASRYIDENVRGGSPELPTLIELLDPPSLPYSPVSPRPGRVTMMGLVAGLTLGAACSLVARAGSRSAARALDL
jgi:uncharacterized protein involved in exopolysaccharide biosynthesis